MNIQRAVGMGQRHSQIYTANDPIFFSVHTQLIYIDSCVFFVFSLLLWPPMRICMAMGVDHGGNGRDKSPRIWSGDANANRPPKCCHIGRKRAFCGLQNTPESVSGRGSAPHSDGGAYDAHSEPLVGWGGVPHNSSQIYAYAAWQAILFCLCTFLADRPLLSETVQRISAWVHSGRTKNLLRLLLTPP